jgi:hypothetical protein
MPTPSSSDPERALERSAEELKERLERLDHHIDEAEHKLPDATPGEPEEHENEDTAT